MNILPYDGAVDYLGPVFSKLAADQWLSMLFEAIPWKNDEVVMFGKRITMARKVAWFADGGAAYSYTGTTKRPEPWSESMLALRSRVQDISSSKYNCCLLNLYHLGSESMSWHSDDEATLVPCAPIASLSFGAERRFCFKHKRTQEKASLLLEHGSLLVMRGSTQTHWRHALPKSSRVVHPRISLTFRTMA